MGPNITSYNRKILASWGYAATLTKGEAVVKEDVVSGKAGLEWKKGLGPQAQAKFSGCGIRETVCIYTPTCQMEVGLSANLFTVGSLAELGQLLDGGAEDPLKGIGFIYRVTPQTP